MTSLGFESVPIVVHAPTGPSVSVLARIPHLIAALDLELPRRSRRTCERARAALAALASVRLGPGEHVPTGSLAAHDLVGLDEERAARGARRSVLPTIDRAAERHHDRLVTEFARREAPTVEDIRRLRNGLVPGNAAPYRRQPAWVGTAEGPRGANLVPPPPKHIEPLLRDVLAWMDRTDVDPILQAALVEFQVGSIHPFTDGNGRLGRALCLAALMRRGLVGDVLPPLSIVLAARRYDYIDTKVAVQGGGPVEPWVDHLGSALETAADSALAVAATPAVDRPTPEAWLPDVVRRARRRQGRMLRVFGLD